MDGVAPAESPIDLYLNEYGGTTANVKVAAASRPETTPSRSPPCSTRTPPAPGTTSTSITSGRSCRRTFRTRRRTIRTCRSPSTSTPTTATRSLRPGTSGNSRSSGSRATPTCTWASSGTTSGGAWTRPIRTRPSVALLAARPRCGRRGVVLDWRDHACSHAIGYGETLAGYRLRDARDDQRDVLRRVGRRQLRIEHDPPHPVEGSVAGRSPASR